MNRYANVLLALSLVMAFGACLRQKKPGIEFPPIIEPLREEDKVGLHLQATAKGNTVFVQVGNYLGTSLPIEPRRFAVITLDKKVVKWDAKTMRHVLPTRVLKPGDTVSGFLRFEPLGDLTGMRFVYYPTPFADPVSVAIAKHETPPAAIVKRPSVNPLK